MAKKTQLLWKAFWLRPRWQRFGAFATTLALVGFGCVIIAWMLVVHHYGKDLPDISWAERYRPPIISNLVSGDDQLLAEFYTERRHVVPYARIPKKLVQAFVAAEDANYFDHPGIDFKGVVRAVVLNVLSGRKKSGASTLTQQTAKAILITHWGFARATEKTFKRKMYEAILARRLEERFTKEEILNLYLNQVYLGHNSYGVQAAAENYFRKNVWDLSLGEMSLLAGLPQSPSRYSPFKHADRAKTRRTYVLGQMLANGMISQAEHDAAQGEDVKVFPVEDVFHETAPFVAEHVRRDVLARYTNDRLLNDGLQIYTTVDLDLEREATGASLKGLLQADKRQGFRGPLQHLEPGKGQTLARRIQEVRELQRRKGAAPETADRLSDTEPYVAAVLAVTKDAASVGVGDKVEGTIPLELMKWARKPNSEVSITYAPALSDATKALAVGDLVLVRKAGDDELKGLKKSDGPVFALEQEPSLQGALVSMDPKSGYILAMIGGYDFNKSEFNRAFQACRQPGSSFKPLYYSAALDGQIRTDTDPRCHVKGQTDAEKKVCWADTCRDRYGSWKGGVWDADKSRCSLTPSTVLFSTNIVTYDESNGKTWKPENFDTNEYGDFPLREALVQSMNLPAIKVLEAVGAREAAAWAHRLGITTPINEDFSIALGSSCVTLWDLTHAYALFNQQGRKVQSTFVRRIEDREGRVLEDHSAYYDPWASLSTRLAAGYGELFIEREQVMDPASAYVTTNLMKEVCKYGTGARAAAMGRPVAGKTGTTNDAFDAWFMGFSPELVTGVWVGYDTYETPMGKYETGGHTALPIWMDYMSAALKGRPIRDFPQPDGVTWAAIDPKTGRPNPGGTFQEAYRSGTEPIADADGKVTPPQVENFFRGQDL